MKENLLEVQKTTSIETLSKFWRLADCGNLGKLQAVLLNCLRSRAKFGHYGSKIEAFCMQLNPIELMNYKRKGLRVFAVC